MTPRHEAAMRREGKPHCLRDGGLWHMTWGDVTAVGLTPGCAWQLLCVVAGL